MAPVTSWTAAVRASRISRIMPWITTMPPWSWSKPPYGKRKGKRHHGWVRIGVWIRVRWWRIIRIRIAYRLLG
jgi:hypothetical protein